MNKLQISDSLSLPVDASTGTFGILATKGAGKSNAAVVMAEEMYDAGIPWVAVDPKGDWWGLRSASDGKGPGLPIVVFGGRHGDVPLEPTAGSLIADLVLAKRLTCVLDVSQFTKADTTRLLLAFGKRLFAHADDNGASPMHLFLEEAHEYLPQVVKGDQSDLVNIWQRIVKQGRFKGLGCTLISQRSSVLNKDVLELIDTLIVLRTIGPLSRKSIAGWVQDQDVDPSLMGSLPSLADGEAWLWSPGALHLSQRIQFRRRRTFDSGSTPKVGAARIAPATLADVDLGAIREAMAATIEKAKADDPKELRKRIADLEKQAKVDIGKPILDPAVIAQAVEDATTPLVRQIDQYETVFQEIGEIAQRLADICKDRVEINALVRKVETRRPSPPPVFAPPPVAPIPAGPVGDLTLKAKQQEIIDALYWWESVGITPSGIQLGAVALIDTSGGYFSNLVGPLVTSGYVVRAGGKCRLTEVGRSLANPLEATPTMAAYHDMLRSRIKGMKTSNGKTLAIFDLMVGLAGEPATNEAIGQGVGIDHTGGYYSNSIGPLSTMDLITRSAGVVSPTGHLFPEGLR